MKGEVLLCQGTQPGQGTAERVDTNGSFLMSSGVVRDYHILYSSTHILYPPGPGIYRVCPAEVPVARVCYYTR